MLQLFLCEAEFLCNFLWEFCIGHMENEVVDVARFPFLHVEHSLEGRADVLEVARLSREASRMAWVLLPRRTPEVRCICGEG